MNTITSRETERRRVLVVDDHRDVTRALQSLLEILGQDVRVASDGASALQLAAEFQPDLVLLDLGLPRMDGYEVARRLRAQPGGTTIELIAISGWGDAGARARSLAAGFDQHWHKPIGLKELKTLVRP
jgi:CheY-like chemotaxis protein